MKLFFEKLWENYTAITPQAQKIHEAFQNRGEEIVNDHIAFRTLNLAPIGLASLEKHVIDLGYKRFQEYNFPAKKLRAVGYVGPDECSPRIFVSELLVEQLSSASQRILKRLADSIETEATNSREILLSGRLWPAVTINEYKHLTSESEYAGWVASLGIRPNHFTISINHFQKHTTVAAVLGVVEELGFEVNESGSRVKGSPEVYLEQGSTLADRMRVKFADGEFEAPTCYYEFAKRYPMPDGSLFQGFVAGSADKIFESTDR